MNQADFEKGKLQLKYHTKNYLFKRLVSNFNKKIEEYLNLIPKESKDVLEIGVGEGQIMSICGSIFPNSNLIAADIAVGILEVAKSNLKHLNNIVFQKEDVINMTFEDCSFDLIVCCEVLEHVPDYTSGLHEIFRCLKPGGYFLCSVPNEPIWRISNMARCSYLKNWGNTPGHVNNWSTFQMRQLLEKHGFSIMNIGRPFPWSIFLVSKIN